MLFRSSGILALAALALGADQACACDTDGLAVQATASNARLNPDWCASQGRVTAGLTPEATPDPVEPGRLHVAQGSIERLAQLLAGRPADVLLCNILAPVIEALCPAFHTVLSDGGLGLLSGLLVDQAPRLQAALAEQGWRAELTAQQSQWGLMTIRWA